MSLRARTCEIAHPHSSAGSQGPSVISRGSSNRIRGWALEPLVDQRAASRFIAQVWEAQDANRDCTRTKVRAVVSNAFLRTALPRSIDGLRVEAVMPLSVVGDHDHSIVYLGKNHPSRLPDQTIHQEMVAANMAATKRERLSADALFIALREKGYLLERLKVSSEIDIQKILRSDIGTLTANDQALRADIEALTILYRQAFTRYIVDLTPEIVAGMLQEAGNIPMIARNEAGQIVSALIAERADLPVAGFTQIPTYELSDFATLQTDQGHGLMTALQIIAVMNIEQLHGKGSAVAFAEDRGCWPAVVASSHKAGLTPVGVLPADVVIGSHNTQFDEGRPPYETLIPVLYGLDPSERIPLTQFIHQ